MPDNILYHFYFYGELFDKLPHGVHLFHNLFTYFINVAVKCLTLVNSTRVYGFMATEFLTTYVIGHSYRCSQVFI